ncbi:xanthine dehydrogenase family protein molybdopterin-binding subunit [Chloroflexota bacterium]
MAEHSFIGKSIPRVDGVSKAIGEALYATDIQITGMLIGKIKRSPYPFARIISIDTSKAEILPGVKAVITAQNVPQIPFGPIIQDELPLADKLVRYVGDGVAAVAAVDAETAEEALDLIKVEYEELTPVFDTEEAMKPGAPAVHPEREEVEQNIVRHVEYVRGEGEAAFKQADLIVEDRFSTQLQHQGYLEPHACIVHWDSSGKVTVWASTHGPGTMQIQLAKALNIPEHRVRIIQPNVGGGFGGKVTPQHFHPIAAFLSKKTGRPVKIVYTREEDFMVNRPRFSETFDLRIGFKKDGTMVAKSLVLTGYAGAYAGVAPAAMITSTIRSDCLYRQPNVKVMANCVYTNNIPGGAMRGYGNTEVLSATESLIDMAADKLGIDPVELRLKNCVHKGDVTVHGWILNTCGLSDGIQIAAEKSDWKNKRQKRDKNHGFGVACQVHVSGNRAIHPLYEGSGAIINVDQTGKVRIISGESEVGQGPHTIFTQIAAEELGVAIEDVEIVPFVDTDIAPFGMGAYASRTTIIGGNAVLKAARDLKGQLKKYAAEKLGVSADNLEIRNSKFYIKGSSEEIATLPEVARDTVLKKLGGAPITGKGEYTVPDYVVPLDKAGYGNYAPAYAFGCQIAEVSVDPETGKVTVLNIWTGDDIGKVINPKLCEGQMEGGIVQGMGYALSEEYIVDKGVMLNPGFRDYKMPLVAGIPKIHHFWIETNEPAGPFGAKGIGEPAMNPTAPAISNAIYNAVGVRIKDLPITSEKILKALKEKNKGK